MAEFIVQIVADDGRKWLSEVEAVEEHAAGKAAILDLQARLPGVNFPQPGSVILVVPDNLGQSPHEIPPSIWSEWS